MRRRAETLRSSDLVRQKQEFEQLRHKGAKLHAEFARVYYLPNELGQARLGLSASRRLGNAVRRNRVKRITRELFRRDARLRRLSVDLLIQPYKVPVAPPRGGNKRQERSRTGESEWEQSFRTGLVKLVALLCEQIERQEAVSEQQVE